jgi:hypothetical protein
MTSPWFQGPVWHESRLPYRLEPRTHCVRDLRGPTGTAPRTAFAPRTVAWSGRTAGPFLGYVSNRRISP